MEAGSHLEVERIILEDIVFELCVWVVIACNKYVFGLIYVWNCTIRCFLYINFLESLGKSVTN